MLFFDNLIINLNHPEYKPILFNLTSFRRRTLSENEFTCVKSMVDKKEQIELFSETELELYHNLSREKQIIDKEVLSIVDEQLHQKYIREHPYFYNETNLNIGIQITQKCNMDCSYCYEKKYLNDNRKTITTEMIDNIQLFYDRASEKAGVEFHISEIRITGGEPLLNEETVGLVKYCAEKWPKAKLNIQTNGLNVLKYYELLPLSQVNCIYISLDGMSDIHMARRYSKIPDESLYYDIINGIKRLTEDKHKVSLSTVVDKTNYTQYSEFKKFLKEQGLLDSPFISFRKGLVNDYNNELGIDINYNNKSDADLIADYFVENLGDNLVSLLPGAALLNGKLCRREKTFVEPKTYRCKAMFFNNHFFSAEGKVYLCDCIQVEKGVLGTYFPKVDIDFTAVQELAFENPIYSHEKCKSCIYKYVCLGGCPLMNCILGKKAVCGLFEDEELLDNLHYKL